jgi:hypothetical protein
VVPRLVDAVGVVEVGGGLSSETVWLLLLFPAGS